MNYKVFDVVVVPFPFTDRDTDKKRPALVLSDAGTFNDLSESCVLAMITSLKNPDWTLDTPIGNIRKAGLPAPSKVRMKLFTLDSRLIIKKNRWLIGQGSTGSQNKSAEVDESFLKLPVVLSRC
jgi:mRNA interferase MazF